MKRFEWNHCNNWFGQHQQQTFIKHSHSIIVTETFFSNSRCTLLIKLKTYHFKWIMSAIAWILSIFHFIHHLLHFQLIQLQIHSLYFIHQLFLLFSIDKTWMRLICKSKFQLIDWKAIWTLQRLVCLKLISVQIDLNWMSWKSSWSSSRLIVKWACLMTTLWHPCVIVEQT